ncbi:MAG: YraN family protein [Pseudomonadota bacterium]
MTAEARRHAERAGRRAETLAEWRYRLAGFAVLARRYKTRAGEVDLVLRRGRLVVFAEVKARRRPEDAVAAVGPQARRRIEAASSLYLARVPGAGDCAVRYDIVAVSGWRPRLFADAWRQGD